MISCEEPPEGTVATLTCLDFYEFYENQQLLKSSSRVCNRNSWSGTRPTCNPGIVLPVLTKIQISLVVAYGQKVLEKNLKSKSLFFSFKFLITFF